MIEKSIDMMSEECVRYSFLFKEGSTENYRKIMDVNVIAMAICSREFAKSIKERKASGHIININRYVCA